MKVAWRNLLLFEGLDRRVRDVVEATRANAAHEVDTRAPEATLEIGMAGACRACLRQSTLVVLSNFDLLILFTDLRVKGDPDLGNN